MDVPFLYSVIELSSIFITVYYSFPPGVFIFIFYYYYCILILHALHTREITMFFTRGTVVAHEKII